MLPAPAGGEVISEDLGHKLEKVELEQLGQVKKVTVTKDDTILLHGGGKTSNMLRSLGIASSSLSLPLLHCSVATPRHRP